MATAIAVTDYAADQERIEADLAELEAAPVHWSATAEAATRYAGRLYQRASLAGNLVQLLEVFPVLDRLLPLPIYTGDLYMLKANAAFKVHRLDIVRECFDGMPEAFDNPDGRAMRADLDLQQGRYEEARNTLQDCVAEEPTWDNLARLAYLTAKFVSAEAGDELYAQAQDEVTSKQMRAYAWIEVQRGLLDFQRGRYRDTREHYRRAERAYSGYWFVSEHLAELLGAEGRYAEAIHLFRDITAQAPRPDIMQAIAELQELAGGIEAAESARQEALEGYRESIAAGHVHYFHHMVDMLSDVTNQGEEAVKWASKDLALRENFSTQSALAWALFRAGRFEDARDWSRKALSSGVVDAKISAQAGEIAEACGDSSAAAVYEAQARELNPAVGSFHVHH